MKRRILYLAVVAGFALQGCQSVGVAGISALPECEATGNKASCNISVNVAIDENYRTCVVTVSKAQEEVIFQKTTTTETMISWTIKDPKNSVDFPVYGIAFSSNSSDFDRLGRPKIGVYEFNNKHQAEGRHKYTIQISHPHFKCLPLDPWIYNR